MKTPSDGIFQLIRAMTPAEKRYFRQFASRHELAEGNKYLQLFDALERQASYDEAAIREQLADESLRRHFAVWKRYLHEQLALALHDYCRANDQAEQVKLQLHVVRILLDKGLDQLAAKRLEKARRAMERYELLKLSPEIRELEWQLLEKQAGKGGSPGPIAQWHSGYAAELALLRHEADYAQLGGRLAWQHQQQVAAGTAADLADEALPSLPEPPRTARAQASLLRARALFCFMRQQAAEAYEHNRALLQLLEQQPARIELYPRQYLAALNNFLIDCQQLQDYDALATGLEKLKGLPRQLAFKRIPGLELKIFEQSALLELNACVSRQHFAAALRLLPPVEAGLEKYQAKISPGRRFAFCYLIAYVYFENARYDEALGWLNRLTQQSRPPAAQEIFRFANLLSLLAHYALGNDELLDYLIPAVRRYNEQISPLYETEKILFRYLKKLLGAKDRTEKEALARQMAQALETAAQLPAEQRPYNYFGFVRWAKSLGQGADN